MAVAYLKLSHSGWSTDLRELEGSTGLVTAGSLKVPGPKVLDGVGIGRFAIEWPDNGVKLVVRAKTNLASKLVRILKESKE